jgi:alanyl-tRNA synthetase
MTALGGRAYVTHTEKKLGDLFVHHVTVEAGALAVGQPAELAVDHERRSAIRANHSATHLLHEALRQTLGDHVAQKGSLVAPDRLRFDFSHPKPMNDDELQAVEDLANRVLLQNEPVVTKLMAVDEAIESGARALFGEKYGDEVRVVSMGRFPNADSNRTFSIELCGGTHVQRTGDIGLITVVSEGAVAAGVRRLEAMTGDAARRHLREESRRLHDIAGLLKIPAEEASERLSAVLDERRKLERELAEARRKLAMGGGGAGGEPVREIGGVKVMSRAVSGVDMRDLKSLADEGKKRLGSGIVAIVGVAEDGKAGIVVGRHRGPDAALRRGHPRARRRRTTRRQGRRRPARHGAGRRPRRGQGRSGARRRRGRARGRLTFDQTAGGHRSVSWSGCWREVFA